MCAIKQAGSEQNTSGQRTYLTHSVRSVQYIKALRNVCELKIKKNMRQMKK